MTPSNTGIAGKFSLRERATLTWARGYLWDHAGLVLIGVWFLIALQFGGPLLLSDLGESERRALFQTIATVSGTMAGLTLTSISIMINLVRTPMSTIDRLTPPADKRRVGDVFLAVIPKLLVTFVAALAGIALAGSPARSTWWVDVLVLWFVSASISSLARIIWVLGKLLKLAD